jgi:DNA replication protein DnaC
MGLEEFGTKVDDERKDKPLRASDNAPSISKEESTNEAHKLSKTQWAVIGDKEYIACSSTVKILKPGMYYIIYDQRYGSVFIEHSLNTDDLIDFPDTIFDRAEKEIENFWALNQEFKNYGFLHRRGFLLYGPAGGGKSCLVSRICKNIINRGGIVFECIKSVDAFFNGLAQFRTVEPDRQMVCIFEDIDALIEQFGEAGILSLLDGENQVDHVINIASTNYPERLDKRIVSRPRRFDRIIKVGMPDENIRRVFFEKKLKINGDDIDKWVKASDGLSFAALSEMVIGVKCLKNDFDEVISRLKEMTSKKVSSSEFDNSSVGFKHE